MPTTPSSMSQQMPNAATARPNMTPQQMAMLQRQKKMGFMQTLARVLAAQHIPLPASISGLEPPPDPNAVSPSANARSRTSTRPPRAPITESGTGSPISICRLRARRARKVSGQGRGRRGRGIVSRICTLRRRAIAGTSRWCSPRPYARRTLRPNLANVRSRWEAIIVYRRSPLLPPVHPNASTRETRPSARP